MGDSFSGGASLRTRRHGTVVGLTIALALLMSAARASAADHMYFAATDNITDVLVQKINAETVRVDISCWYLTEHSISIALINKFHQGVPIRLIGDRGSIFEIDRLTKNEFYWLANQGLPIRLRFNPTWYPEIDHWKMSIFVGQGLAAFGSANYTPFELAPVSSTNYKDETVLLTDDPTIVGAVKTKFDRIWNDTTPEPESLIPSPPYLKNWNDACVAEPTGCDYFQLNPNPAPMVINTARLEPDNPLPPDLIWGQGPDFNDRLVQEINNENTAIQFIIYRLTVDNITQALLNKKQAGVPIQLIIEPNEYLNRKWPEFWLTHANLDKLWAAGIPMKQRIHDGLTHMKTLVTSTYVTNASSNYAAAWQRDVDYFISAAAKPSIYQAVKDRVTGMWNNTAGFATFQPQPPDAPTLVSPANNATGVATNAALVWNIAPFAVSYDVFVGSTSSNMTLVGNVPAQMVNNPPSTYSWTPTTPLQPGTQYFWKIVSRTNATPVNPSLVAPSSTFSFTTAGSTGPPDPPASPSPSDGATGVSTSPTLGWSTGAVGTTYTVAFGTATPPPQVATNLSAPSYAPGTLAPNTTYYWRVTAVTSGGSTAGAIWSFVTGSGSGGTASDAVIYAADVTPANIHGSWSQVADTTAAAGVKLTNPDAGVAALSAPLANPTNYFDATFQAAGGTRYRAWFRIHAIGDSKWNDSVFVQYSDSVDSTGAAVYRTGTTSGMLVNLWTCATCQSFGWGWQRNAYWLADTGDVWFQNSGAHTIRVQIREDGVEIDQIVLSPVTYATNPPGPVSNDTTIVPKPSQAPGAPGLPSPANGATGVGINPTLTWTASDATSYDVSFGTTNPPPLVVSGQASASYTPPALTNDTPYFWQIVARNSAGSTPGAVWSFRTAVAPPATPSAPSPADGATGVTTTLTLTWTSAGATTYDVLFGPTDPPSQVASGLTSPSYTPTGLAPNTQYFWQIVAHNVGGANQGPEWTFTTAPAAPATPASPAPAAGATGVSTTPTLTWTATGATSYDVAFGAANPPPTVATGQSVASFSPAALANNTTYYWQITARNSGGSTSGPVWSFTTMPNPPAAPGSPSPAAGATNVSVTPTLAWSASGATTYDIRFGTANPPPVAVAGQAAASYAPGTLAFTTTYFWQIVAINTAGTTTGPVWSFTTGAQPPSPPGTPASPSPADAATGVSTSPTLTWSSTNATSYDVKFGTANPPTTTVSSGQAAASYAPAGLANSTTYYWQIVATNTAGSTTGPVWSFTTAAAPEIVIYASDVPAAGLHGTWTLASDATAAAGAKLITPDSGWASTANALATPADYIEVTFTAPANTPYAIWLRLQATNNSKYNDSIWVQFSDAVANGSQVYPLSSTSALDVNLATDATAASLNGWGWQNGAYWLAQATTVTFASSGTHTMRIQIREDGVQLDQIVLSPTTYLSVAPGSVTADSTIVPKP